MRTKIIIVVIAMLVLEALTGCSKKETYNTPINRLNTNLDEDALTLASGNYREEKEGIFINYYDLNSNRYLGYKNTRNNNFTDSLGNQKSVYIKEPIKNVDLTNQKTEKISGESNTDTDKQKTLNKNNFIQYGKLFSILKSKYPPKTEFESWDVYKARCSDACTGEYIVKIDLGEFRKRSSFLYNAENQTITFTVPKSIGTGISSRTSLHGIEVSDFQKTGKNKGSYLGSNAFGVTKTVKIIEINYDILSAQPDVYKNSSFDFKCDPDTAKKIQNNFGIAVMFNIDCKRNVPSLAVTEKKYSSPTINSPFSGTDYYNVVPVIVKAIYVYDQKSYDIITSKTF